MEIKSSININIPPKNINIGKFKNTPIKNTTTDISKKPWILITFRALLEPSGVNNVAWPTKSFPNIS